MRHLVAVIAAACITTSAFADPISLTNDRQVPISDAGGDDSVQTSLNEIFDGESNPSSPTFDAATDQETAGYFMLAIPGSGVTSPQLKLKNTSTLGLGMFTIDGPLDTTSTVNHVTIFGANASVGAKASVFWDAGSVDTGVIVVVDPFLPISITSFSGIDLRQFGFWADASPGDLAGRVYTLDDMNDSSNPGGGTAKVLSYNLAGTNEWAFAFETDGYNDYNEAVILIESITPVPEPGTFALLGLGVVGFAVIRRRRRR